MFHYVGAMNMKNMCDEYLQDYQMHVTVRAKRLAMIFVNFFSFLLNLVKQYLFPTTQKLLQLLFHTEKLLNCRKYYHKNI